MLNKHRDTKFSATCFICGKPIKQEHKCTSYMGLRCNAKKLPNTIWMHINCSLVLVDSTVEDIKQAVQYGK
jgi:hypothetical protein